MQSIQLRLPQQTEKDRLYGMKNMTPEDEDASCGDDGYLLKLHNIFQTSELSPLFHRFI